MGIAIVTVVIFGLFGFMALGMYLNAKTPIPEGYDLQSLKCAHCTSSTCVYAKDNLKNKLKEACEEGVNND